MNMDQVTKRHWNIEHSLFAVAFLLALGVRIYRLGAVPLSDQEANWALQALSVARGEQVSLGPQPLYAVITGTLFYLLGSTNFLARALPALTGAGLVLLPLAYRRQFGRQAGLILAFALALDPGLVATSRVAGSPIPALFFSLVAVTAFFARYWAVAGIFSALALLSGTGVVSGAIALALTWGLGYWLQKEGRLMPIGWFELVAGTSRESIPDGITGGRERPARRTLLYWLAATLLLAGTLLLRVPQGLGAMAATFPAYFEGWAVSSGVPALRLPVALLVYQPLLILFGLFGILRAWRNQESGSGFFKYLSLWGAFSLLLGLVYPSRQVADLVWVIVPLWALAAYELARKFTHRAEQPAPFVSAGQASLMIILLVFAWLMLASLGNVRTIVTPEILQNALILIFGALLMAGLTATLVGLGWSWDVSRQGLLWGVTASLALWMLSGTVGSTQLRQGAEQELWTQSPVTTQVDLLLSTLGDLSAWETGHRQSIDVAVMVEAPSLRWVLRDFPQARFGANLSPGEMPAAIIAYLGQETPTLTASYRGQDFAWQVYPAWQGVLPDNLAQWLAFRAAPIQHSKIILWARDDIFPDGSQFSLESDMPLDDILINPGAE
jgi:hypothetical protein